MEVAPTRKDRRRKKDDVINGDNSTDLKIVKQESSRKRRKKNSSDEEEDEPVLSSVKREAQPVRSSSEVIELRQQLILARQEKVNAEQQAVNFEQLWFNSEQHSEALKNDLREAVLRAERAEDELDSKQGANVDDSEKHKLKELKKEVKDLKKQLKEKREVEKQEKRANKKIYALTKELDEEKSRSSEKEKSMEKSVGDLKKQLKEEKSRASEKEKSMEKSVSDLTKQLEQEREGRRKAVNEIGRLRLQLASNTRSGKAQAHPIKMEDDAGRTGPVVHSATDHEPRNILLLLDSTAKNAISIDEGVEKVNAAFNKCTLRTLNRLKDKHWYGTCGVCGVEVSHKLAVTTHFVSAEHIEKVRAHNASVSRNAVIAWAHTLDQIEVKSKLRRE